MPLVKKPGMVGVYVELTEELRDRVKAFAAGRKEQFVEVVRLALERHLAYPPSPPVPPPPPSIPAYTDAVPATASVTPPAKKPRKKPAG